MAAKIFSPPETIGLGPPPGFDAGRSFEEQQRLEEAWVAKLREWCKQHGSQKPDVRDLVGQELYFPAGDGHARYMIFRARPLELIHIPLGDAWHFQYAHLMTLAEVRRQLGRKAKLAKLFGGGK